MNLCGRIRWHLPFQEEMEELILQVFFCFVLLFKQMYQGAT
jgi:hypothetical protein